MTPFFPKLNKLMLMGLFSATLAACAVGPDYKAPKTELLPFHNTTSIQAKEGAPAPTLEQWWTGFNDPVLVRIVERALDHNLDLAASLARVEQSRAAAAGADASLMPQVELGASVSATRQSMRGPAGSSAGSSPGFKRNIHEASVGPSASWELDLFGGLRKGASAAHDEAQATRADYAGTRVIVVADAADAYLQVRGYQARIAIAQQQIDTDTRLLELVKRRYAAGAAQGLEVAQADALLKNATATVPPLRIGLERQLNRLDVLMGAQPGTYADELGQIAEIPGIPAIPGDAAPVDVLRRRPDIIAAERRLAASNARIGAAISDYYPKVSLSGLLGFNALGGSLFTKSAFQAIGGAGLRWRLFDFGRVDAEVAQAKGANAESLAVYRQSVLRAAEDVENAFMGLSQTEIHMVQLQDQIKALELVRSLSERAYRAGSITLTDVLDADRQLLVARDEMNSSRADAARAAVGVFRALGGGWDLGTNNTTAIREVQPAL
jgi:NodT family efflux transporter outer membrane factor (OMF) lipoprotein